MTKPQPRVIFLDAATFGDLSLERFSEAWECTLHRVTQPAQTISRLAGHAVAVTNKVAFDKPVFDAPQTAGLKLIAVAATGTDVIDKAAAAKHGVTVCNVPGYASQSVAQFTMALMLELATRAGSYGADVKAGAWQKSPVYTLLTYPQVELSG